MIRCLSGYLGSLMEGASTPNLFINPPVVDFRPSTTHCGDCACKLVVRKTRLRVASTLHIGQFHARETVLICPACGRTYRSEELCTLVAPGANFGYDVMIHAGKALFLRHRNEEEVVAELAERNVQISLREVSLLGTKFITYLAMAQRRCAPDIAADMQSRGGYICHLDATCEGGNPLLMSSIDSLSDIVLGNVKLPAESEANIVPFLERIKKSYGAPFALVHDMGKGILAAAGKVFPGVPDFICHFHFLRDIGKDYLGGEYDIIRKRLRHHGISAKLRYRAKQLKAVIDRNPEMIRALESTVRDEVPASDGREFIPTAGTYSLIQWVLQGKSDGDGYGFPFDHPLLTFAKRIRNLHAILEKLQPEHLRGRWQDNKPYFKVDHELKDIMKDQALWKAVEAIEKKTIPFEKLRRAMRIAPVSGRNGLNDEGRKENIRTIEARVKKFRSWMIHRKNHAQDPANAKMIKQIDKYWEKLFADPLPVQTPSGPLLIQPQRTNNILEQFFRSLKRAHRRRTGNASSRRMLRTILAET
ncbi:MAG: transposase, partial [Gammaproteobacteria bacterium]|nr:transposase [Gammaproteobacteria bacterium]